MNIRTKIKNQYVIDIINIYTHTKEDLVLKKLSDYMLGSVHMLDTFSMSRCVWWDIVRKSFIEVKAIVSVKFKSRCMNDLVTLGEIYC